VNPDEGKERYRMRLVAATWLTVAWTAAQVPDRAPRAGEWGYRPENGATVTLNPPSLCWAHEADAAGYDLQWASDAEFREPEGVEGLLWSAYTHNKPLKPGRWWWRYRIHRKDGSRSPWSHGRAFSVPPNAVVFPQPSMDELRERIPRGHPRLFVQEGDLPRLRDWARGDGREWFSKILARAEELTAAEPTPEPAVKASASDPATRQYWWSNRVQTIRALQEAEILAFTWLLTGDARYGDAARRFTLRLAAWDPDGSTSFKVNCEAAKPMLHRLARAYDWAWPLFSEEERGRIRSVLLRRALDAWNSGEVRQGAGHLNQPYNSHGNRTWHKLAENAIATFGETPESEKFLAYAVTKFFAAYPVWSDDDGGWHEGLSYFAGYMSKVSWWMEVARTALGIDGFKKPFFKHFGDYPLYSAPPGSPDMGFGDLSHRPPGAGWSFMHYFVRRTGNPYWAWWLEAWKIPAQTGEPVLDFLWSSASPVPPRTPAELPPSRVFRGTGVAVLNTNLTDSRDNVQVRFKSSPMGTWSHGLDPQNSFTLNAFGERLLVNCVYRDLYGSPFHRGWVWSTRAHNAVLVNGSGQKPRSPEPGGRIVRFQLDDGFDYVAGEAAPSYEGRLRRAVRHVFFVKPDVIILADELEAPEPARFQWMLHALEPFRVDSAAPRLEVQRGRAGVRIDYLGGTPLVLRQWSGYEPEPDHEYLQSVGNPGIPPQWHAEAATQEVVQRALTFTVLRVFRGDQVPAAKPVFERRGSGARLGVVSAEGSELELDFRPSGRRELAVIRKNERTWRITE
jgi:hypothetical protein